MYIPPEIGPKPVIGGRYVQKKRPTRKKYVYIRRMYKVAAVHKGENLASGLYGMGGSQLALWGENVCG